MGGFFGVASKHDCVTDLFFGTDYHSHLGTRRAGMAVYGREGGFDRAIHNIQNSPFRTKFERDVLDLKGTIGIGCISDYDPQPLLVSSHLGDFALTVVGKINNTEELVQNSFDTGTTHFMGTSSGVVNSVELVASLICGKGSFPDGIRYAQEVVEGSMSLLLMTPEGIFAARDRLGRTPVVIGKKEDAYCVAFESYSYFNLGYEDVRELGPGEIVFITPDGVEDVKPAGNEMRICTFLWIYYGYPTATYEGVNVEMMRYNCGDALARRDLASGQGVDADMVAGVPDSGVPHAIGYSNRSGIPFARPFIKYTPTWPRSFMPTNQSQRNLVARMKLIPVKELIHGKSMVLIDDSIVRGTQLRETTEFLYHNGAKEVHIRPACPPLVFPCKYLNFSRTNSEFDLITRRIIRDREGENVSQETLANYADPDHTCYKSMVEDIRKQLNFTTLNFHRLDDMVESVGIEPCKLCTYCWNGKE
ncbi:MAG: amidophosphoribosyltransferase [Lachnospiraceae bacterium]|nr:amidophosphoribosyltransferase [Lachnospiraceae bacterium]